MLDVFRVADLLVAHALETAGDEVDLIAIYGSHAKGTASPRSDLDIFYTPAEGRRPLVGRTVLIEGILFDFWPIPWERLEAWAVGRDRGWSQAAGVIHHARLLHARSEAHAARFAALKQKTFDLQQPEARPQMIRRALDEFRSVLAHLGNLRLAASAGDLADARHAGWKLVLAVRECLALANQTLVDQGGKTFLGQMATLPFRPAELEALVVEIGAARESARTAAAAEKLAMATREVLRELQASLPATQRAADEFREAYPEIHAGLGKVLTACEHSRPVDAALAAWFAQYDLSLMLSNLRDGSGHGEFNLYREFAALYREIGLPDLMECPADDPAELASRAGAFDARFREWLGEQSIALCEFTTLEEFEHSLRGPHPPPAPPRP